MDNESKQLLEMMGASNNLSCNIVTAGFENLTPSRHKIKVIEIGVVYYYTDNTTDQDGPTSTNLGPGDVQTLMSPCTEKCCHRVFGAMVVKAPNQDPVTITSTQSVKEGECWLVTKFQLIIKNKVSESALTSGELALEIVGE